jgi:hypothetical protein
MAKGYESDSLAPVLNVDVDQQAAARAVGCIDCFNLKPSSTTLAANLQYPLTDGAARALLEDLVPLRHARDVRHPGLVTRIGVFVLSTLGTRLRRLAPRVRRRLILHGIASRSGPATRFPARGQASCGVMVLAASFLVALIIARPVRKSEPAAVFAGRL